MEIEYWHLLFLPFFFALGWLAARVDIRHVMRESRSLPRSYFQGLNFLLNEEPGKAIDAFLEVSRQDSHSVELNFALGGLFRRRGETERAIRMHQALADREGLNHEVKLQALFELGQDYLKAGLLDRAETLFVRLRGSALENDAKRQLLEIYQTEKDWKKAIQIANDIDDPQIDKIVAHFYCELAERDLAYSQPDAAMMNLTGALQRDRQCARANLLAGDIALQRHDLTAALSHWQAIEGQNPACLALVARRLRDFTPVEKQADVLNLLKAWLERYPAIDLFDAVCHLETAVSGNVAAYQLARAELKKAPSLLGLEKLIDTRLPIVDNPASRDDLALAQTILQGHTGQLSRYRCYHCGFRARQFYWRCPACGEWESAPPRRVEEIDAAD